MEDAVRDERGGVSPEATPRRHKKAQDTYDQYSTIGQSAAGDDAAVAELVPKAFAEELGLTTLALGWTETSGLPEVVHVGNRDPCEGVINLKHFDDVHCQFALRKFRVGDSDKVHEALFLKDLASKTYVNGQRAWTPWHWLQHDDEVGIRPPEWALVDEAQRPGHWPFLKVRYCNHQPLYLDGDTIQAPDDEPEPPQELADAAASSVGAVWGGSDDAVGSSIDGRGQGGGRGGRGRGGASTRRVRKHRRDVIGQVIDVDYVSDDETTTYRVKVTGFEPDTGFHHVDSDGYSLMRDEEGEDTFTDVIDLNGWLRLGRVRFVDSAEVSLGVVSEAPRGADEEAPLASLGDPSGRRGRKRSLADLSTRKRSLAE